MYTWWKIISRTKNSKIVSGRERVERVVQLIVTSSKI